MCRQWLLFEVSGSSNQTQFHFGRNSRCANTKLAAASDGTSGLTSGFIPGQFALTLFSIKSHSSRTDPVDLLIPWCADKFRLCASTNFGVQMGGDVRQLISTSAPTRNGCFCHQRAAEKAWRARAVRRSEVPRRPSHNTCKPSTRRNLKRYEMTTPCTVCCVCTQWEGL